ncbi:RecQ family ATP-dependent DNA helicase [Aquimarina sp. 2201CG14-23]|uniref:RecQ family ATP-dependent DNA helicase n=1 Tax=Aquimarina mycalae TaxID=3040073 RepID=UPI002477E032|nr:ATP-dependent DNA helicase RecQ [Aquimarina sp. 2201CG14-23]MDH7446650.1 ATP-dependent DNA helicase RecQ [Aquimarina sp. 2201CG14-23]
MNTPIQLLQQNWNYDTFRPLQEEIINAVVENNDTFALLPTGGGKSICFQIPALLKEGICIVTSPLIALMQDQVQHLQQKGIKAIALTSGIKYSELDTLLDNCIYGNYKFLYLSPERLQQDLVKERLKRMNINLIAIDEAHCISQWGNDFRPSYKKIKVLREIKPAVPMIALTASATPEVVDDIIKELDLFQPKIFRQSFYRSNLGYMVYHTLDKNDKLIRILNKYKGSSIVYVRNRKSAIEISDFLRDSGFAATYYHGGVDTKEKTKRFQQWISEEIQIMVATNAFGMGIDKANVKTIIHYNIPESIESYFQEAGRAGRNGETSYAFLLKNENDILRVQNQFIKVLPNIDFVKSVYRKLCNYFRISYGEGEQTVHGFNFNIFCKTYKFPTLMTYNALQYLDRCSVINFTQRFTKKSSLHVTTTGNQLLNYIENNPHLELITKAILRTYGGIFDEEVTINLSLIASKVNTIENTVIEVLEKLQEADLVLFNHKLTDADIVFLVPREDDHTINRVKPFIKELNDSKTNKVKNMIGFVQNETLCRNKQLLSYFGEKNAKNCGVCSVCVSKKNTKVDPQEIRNDIISLLQNKQLSSRAILTQLKYPEEPALAVLRELNERNIIKIDQHNNYQLL